MKPGVPLLIILTGGLLISGCPQAPAPTKSLAITASVDTTVTTIGHILHFRVTVLNSGQRLLRFTPWASTDTMEVRQVTPFKSTTGDRSGLLFQIVFWDTGHFVIPPYEVAVLKADSSLDYTLQSKPLEVQVVSVLKASGATQLRPVKAPVPVVVPWPWKTVGKYALLILLVVGLVILYRQRQDTERLKQEVPVFKAPPDEVAREKLQALRRGDYLRRGAVKEFYVLLSYLLREYVEHSFFIKTLEMTTAEIQIHRHAFPFDSKLLDQWLEVLRRADYAKYARGSVAVDVCEQDLAWAEKFINETLPYWKILSPAAAEDPSVEGS